jgi:hypothetical protein
MGARPERWLAGFTYFAIFISPGTTVLVIPAEAAWLAVSYVRARAA